jgi:nicotinamidase-related amidase
VAQETFAIDPRRTAMLFFDTLNHYLHPDDPAARAEIEAAGIIPAMVKMNEACRKAGIPIFFGQADHRPDRRDFAPQIVDKGYRGSPAGGTFRTSATAIASGSPGAAIIPELGPRPEDYVIKKHRWSTFYQTHFELSLRTAGLDTIMIAGGSTEVGVASTAYSARDRDFNIIILRDACHSGAPGVDDFFMDRIFPIFARVRTVDQAIAEFAR